MQKLRKRIQRNYDLLVDIAFWAFMVQSIIPWLRIMGFTKYRFEGPLQTISGVGFFLTWLLVVLLVIARFARDEYAEGLWQRVGRPVIMLLVIAPWIACLAFLINFERDPDAFARWAGQHLPDHIAKVTERAIKDNHPVIETVGIASYFSMVEVLFWTGAYLPFILLGLYKWQRWRDS